MPPKKDITGRVYGSMIVCSWSHEMYTAFGGTKQYWNCKCAHCDLERVIGSGNIASFRSIKCICQKGLHTDVPEKQEPVYQPIIDFMLAAEPDYFKPEGKRSLLTTFFDLEDNTGKGSDVSVIYGKEYEEQVFGLWEHGW
jgi:hypothetical protein